LASETVATLVTEKHLSEGRLYPPLTDIREISVKIATAVAEYCYEQQLAGLYPEPSDKEVYIRARLYRDDYNQFLPDLYNWPNH